MHHFYHKHLIHKAGPLSRSDKGRWTGLGGGLALVAAEGALQIKRCPAGDKRKAPSSPPHRPLSLRDGNLCVEKRA